MKRSDCLGLMKAAGYHGDKATFTQLLIENRVSRFAAEAAFRLGAKAKVDGVPCGCSDCREDTAKENPVTILWVIPVRHWEDKEPDLLQVEGDADSSERSLYGFMPLYGHKVYIERTNAFPTRDAAITEAIRRTAAREAEFSARADRLIEAELAKETR